MLSVVDAADPGDQVVLSLTVDDELVDVTLTACRRLEVKGHEVQSNLAHARRHAWNGGRAGAGVVVRRRTVWGSEERPVLQDCPSTRDLIDAAQADRIATTEFV